jgi:YD repeat-containing protein
VKFRHKEGSGVTGFSCISQALVLLTFALSSAAVAQVSVSYTYDSLGRLVTVTDSAGATAVYTYDAVGNILSVQRLAAGTLNIFNVFPAKAVVGGTVTISGSGFSSTPTQNTVKFNGVSATVDSAGPSQLVVRVPAGGTSGPVTVQVGTASTSSTASFTVLQSLPATLSALAGKPGETLTINGSGFPLLDPTLRVRFNGGYLSTPTSVTATSVTVTVPSSITPGPVTVETPTAVYTSASDFYPMPSKATEASAAVTLTRAISVDAPASRTTTTTSGAVSLIRVPLTGGDLTLSVVPQVVGGTEPVTVNVYNPQGNLFRTLSLTSGTPASLHLDPADVALNGIYTLLISGTTTAGYDLNVAALNDGTQNLTLGVALNFGPTKASQYLKLPLAAAEPGPVNLVFTGTAISSGGTVGVRKFDTSVAPLTSGNSAVLDTLSTSAPTRLRIEPGANTVVSGSLTATGTLVQNVALGGTPPLFTANFPTQWVKRQVTTTAGQAIGVSISDLAAPGGSGNANISATTPAGTFSTFYSSTFIPTLIIPNPGAGAAAVTVNPLSGATSNAMNVQVGPSTLLTAGAATAAVTGNTDAHTFAHFNVASTDKLQVVVSNLTFGTATGQGKVFVQRPDNFYTSASSTSGANMVFRVDGAVASGVYALTIDPPAGGPVATRLRLMSSAPTIVDNLPVNFATTVADEALVHNFTGAAATPRSLIVKGLTFTGGTGNGRLYLFLPNGNSTSISLPSNYNWMFGNLNIDGPYTALVIPPVGGTTSGQMEVTTGTPIVKGTPLTFSTATAGQGYTATYTGAVGENLGLALSNLVSTPANTNPSTVMVFRPDGNLLSSFTATSAAGGTANLTLPVAGNYVISTFPPGGTTAGKLSLSADLAPALIVGAAASTQTTTLAGQNTTATFTGAVNQNLKLVFSAVTFAGTAGTGTVKLYRPDGVQIIWTPNTFAAGTTPTTINLPTLTQAGTYKLVIEGPGISTSSYTVQLATR